MSKVDEQTCGFIYVATGKTLYGELALQSAGSLKSAMPKAQVDVYLDQGMQDALGSRLSLFDQVHVLENPWKRSKIDSLSLSRFEHTVFLDGDTLVLEDLSGIFALLEKFDVVGCHDQGRSSEMATNTVNIAIPSSFPQINTGVLGIKRSQPVLDAISNWRRTMIEADQNFDQPSFRETLWLSDLRIAILPEEYNVTKLNLLDGWQRSHPTMRILHAPKLHRNFEAFQDAEALLLNVIGRRKLQKLRQLQEWDLTLDEAQRAHHNSALFRADFSDLMYRVRKRLLG